MNTLRSLRVCALTDRGGTMGMSQEEEYAQMKKSLQEIVYPDVDIIFEKDVTPDDLIKKEWDIYVFDYGGAMAAYGSEERYIDSYYRPLIRRIKGHPEKLFVIWSSYTQEWYRRLIEEESPELVAPNVITMEWRPEDIKRARTFWGLTPDFSHEAYFKRIDASGVLKTPKGFAGVGR